MSGNNNDLEKRLWEAADQLRANSRLTAQEYSRPVLGLIFLKYADFKFSKIEKGLKEKNCIRRRPIGKLDYQAKGVLYLPEKAQYYHLINLPEEADIGGAINNAMRVIEEENTELKGILPKTYNILESTVLFELLKIFNGIQMDIEGDVFGKIYEYFLGKFAMAEGRGGGEFFTPTSIVKLIINIIEPFHGFIYDPACGSGGMFVQSAKFVEEHQKKPINELSIYGQESKESTLKLAKMNLAVHGLSEDIRLGNSYYEDHHGSLNKFDFVMANPPFNVNGVDKERIKDYPTYSLGLPRTDNANYLWIQIFHSSVNQNGRAGFVMANSASDARQSELEIRKKLIQRHAVDVMVAISSNFFYTVTLPVTLWFLDKGKINTDRKDKILFIDARTIFTQIDRAHREFIKHQIEYLANIVRMYRRENLEIDFCFSIESERKLLNHRLEECQQKDRLTKNCNESITVIQRDLKILDELESQWKTQFPDSSYCDIKGLCKVATINEIESQGWSLNPGRYVGVEEQEDNYGDFAKRLKELNDELVNLNSEANKLEEKISHNISQLLNSIK